MTCHICYVVTLISTLICFPSQLICFSSNRMSLLAFHFQLAHNPLKIPTRLAIPLLPLLYLLYLITPTKRPTLQPSPLSALLFSLPTNSRYLQSLNLIINSILFLAVLDFTITPFLDTAADLVFTRVGAIYPDSAKVVVRYPKANATEHTLLILYRESPTNTLQPPWKDGPLLHLNESLDWVDTVRLTNLWPATSYQCQSPHQYSFPLPNILF